MPIRLATIPASVSGIAALLAGQAILTFQESVHFVPADRVTVRRMSEVPAIDLAPGVRVRTVVGTTGSFSIGDFEPASAAVLHHHTREQADIAITGEFDMTLGDTVEKLAPGFAVIVPPDVSHSIANNGRDRMTIIEFHTVRRPDLVPPRPALSFPARATPVPLASGRLLVQPMDRPVRESPSSSFWLRGDTCRLAWRRLSSGSRRVELRAGVVERFVYLVRGELEMTAAGGRERVTAGSLIVVPARAAVTIQASGPEQAAVVEFIPASSEK
jgi:mannose-6-phosphate isomerase-like protein (cupin superfamily)